MRYGAAEMSDGRLTHDFIDAYEVLGVAPSATPEQIKAAYRRLAARHHPDVVGEDHHAATLRMQQINVAYGLIAHPDMRQRYDRVRRARQARQAFSGDDQVWSDLLQAAGRWVGRQRRQRRGGWYRAGYAVGRWLRD